MGGGGLGIGAIIVVFAISYFTGINPAGADGRRGDGRAQQRLSRQTQPATTGPAADPNDPMRKFLSHVLGQTEERLDDGAAAADGRAIHAGAAGAL